MNGAALTPVALALLAFCIVAEVVRELCFKAGATRAAAGGSGYVRALLRTPLVWAGILAWAVEVVAWVAVLERVPLGIAFPVMTLTYAAVPVAGIVCLRERLARGQLVGAALVAAGVVCVGLSAG